MISIQIWMSLNMLVTVLALTRPAMKRALLNHGDTGQKTQQNKQTNKQHSTQILKETVKDQEKHKGTACEL